MWQYKDKRRRSSVGLLSLLLLIWGKLCNGETAMTNPTNHPIVFTHIGKLINSGSHFVVPLRLDLRSLIDTVTPLSTALSQTSSHYHALRDLMGGNSSRRGQSAPALSHFPATLRDHISLLMYDLHERLDNLKNVVAATSDIDLDAPASLRRTRGLFNLGGETLSWMFGVVDSATFQEAEDALNQLQELSEIERETMNLHSKIINITTHQILRMERNQNKTMQALSEMDSNVKLLSTALLKQSMEIYTISNTMALVSAIGYVSSAVADMSRQFDRFVKGLETMVKGNLSPELFPAEELVNVITQLNSRNVRTLWPSSHTFLPLFYKFSSVISINYEELTFLVLLPLLPEPNGELNLYRINSLPYPLNANVTMSYGSLAPYIGVSKDHSLYVVRSEVELASCRQFASIFYCDNPTPLYRNSRLASCEFALYINRDIDQHCVRHLSGKLDRPLLMKSGDLWLYATSQRFTLTVVCPGQTQSMEVQIGVGTIQLPPRCRASSEFALIPTSISIRKRETSVIKFTNILPFNISFNEKEMSVVEKFTNDSLFQDLLQFNGQPVPLTALHNELGQLRIIQKQRRVASTTSAIAGWTSLGLIIFLVIVCFAVGFCCYLLKGNNYRVDNTIINWRRRNNQNEHNPEVINLNDPENRD